MPDKAAHCREFQIFAKPVGARCNLSCVYCYYPDKQGLYSSHGMAKISENLLEKYIIQHIEATTEDLIMFSWHGGEPTLAGLDFFRKIVEFQKKYNKTGKPISNGIQTNGTLLNEEWCQFLACENFIVGISIDGPENLHNKYRISKSGIGSFKQVVNGYELLNQYDITTEILCVVNANNVEFPNEVYSYFKSLNTNFISFLPLVEKGLDLSSGASSDSVPAEAFGDFLIQVFDEWQENDIGKIKIQLFEEAFRTAFKQEHTLCIFKKACGGVPVLERNGDIFSCDHFVNKDYLLGNINHFHLIELLDSPQQKNFGQAKYDSLPDFCLKCDVLEMCYGECPKNRFIKSPAGKEGLNYLCPGYIKFFRHCKPFIEAISMIWNNS
jgi:uncharacterized protein